MTWIKPAKSTGVLEAELEGWLVKLRKMIEVKLKMERKLKLKIKYFLILNLSLFL